MLSFKKPKTKTLLVVVWSSRSVPSSAKNWANLQLDNWWLTLCIVDRQIFLVLSSIKDIFLSQYIGVHYTTHGICKVQHVIIGLENLVKWDDVMHSALINTQYLERTVLNTLNALNSSWSCKFGRCVWSLKCQHFSITQDNSVLCRLPSHECKYRFTTSAWRLCYLSSVVKFSFGMVKGELYHAR